MPGQSVANIFKNLCYRRRKKLLVNGPYNNFKQVQETRPTIWVFVSFGMARELVKPIQ